MRVRVLAGAAALMIAACASVSTETSDVFDPAFDQITGGYQLSDAALSTAVRDSSGTPLGAFAYPTPAEAVKAGDMAAFIASVKLDQLSGDIPPAFASMILALDRVADDDFEGAQAILDDAQAENPETDLPTYLESWLLALAGDGDAAVETHRASANALPGLTADLSLAAMLEGLGRDDEALAVYASLTPGEITAPEHDFDPQGLVFGHVQTVVARRTLLLRRLDRVDEAKAVYSRLAEAEPEQAARYAAAIQALEDGEGVDGEPLSARSALARTLADLSLALYQQKLIRAAVVGRRLTGFDDQRSALEQMALLLDPENDDIRELVIDGLYAEALFDGVAHVARGGPEPNARLELAAARALLMSGDRDAAKTSVERAFDAVEDDDRLSVLTSSAGLLMLIGEEGRALSFTEEALELAENDAERAFVHSVRSQVFDQFAAYQEAADEARRARDLDDTHDRRMFLVNALGDAGEIDEALRILRTERLSRPNDPYMLNSLGYFLVTRTDRYEEGYKVLGRAVALANNNNPYINDSFGWARYQLGDMEGARRFIESARDELAPHTHWEIDDHLGDVYWRLGREEDAREAWARALKTYPPEDIRADVEAKLEDGLTTPAPEKRPLPNLSLDDNGEVQRQDI